MNLSIRGMFPFMWDTNNQGVEKKKANQKLEELG